MEKYCQNPLCENEAVKEVRVSVRKASDQRRALCGPCEEAYSWGVQHGQMSGLRIEPPPREKGPEPLYRVIYTIDVNAPNAHKAAERAYEIMRDPASMRPVLHILDCHGHDKVVDLAVESCTAPASPISDESQEKARKFVLAGGTRCPGCGGEDIDFGRVDVDAQCAYQEACCGSCNTRFCAVYRLVGYGLYTGDSFEIHTTGEDFGEIKGSAGRTPTGRENDQDPKTV
jgi:transcription elongation factor Elf1